MLSHYITYNSIGNQCMSQTIHYSYYVCINGKQIVATTYQKLHELK